MTKEERAYRFVESLQSRSADLLVQLQGELGTTQARMANLAATNTAIQDWVSAYGESLPNDLLKLLADLDWAVNTNLDKNE